MPAQEAHRGQAEEAIGLHNLKPADGSRKSRKRVGRGHGSGMGKTSGRGQKGAGSRSGSKSRANFEGGQMPIHMRMRKLRGPHMKKSMPFEPFRTHTQPVNLGDLEARFEAGDEVTPETLRGQGPGDAQEHPVKVLAKGELTKKLTVRAHGFSAAAKEAIEAAGGTAVASRRPARRPCDRRVEDAVERRPAGPRHGRRGREYPAPCCRRSSARSPSRRSARSCSSRR